MPAVTTRFAPSPTGPLHLGHALAAVTAHDLARRSGGKFLLRMEDIDHARCRAEFEAGILADLRWLGLTWDGPVLRQSEHMQRYREALASLERKGLTYPCFCTRGDIAAEIARMPGAPQETHQGRPDWPVYPGTCRELAPGERAARVAEGEAYAFRLDIAACLEQLGNLQLEFEESGRGPAGETGTIPVNPRLFGDFVLGRKDLGVSYNLAVVLDDHLQEVSLVSRGEDLFASTHVHVLLQAVMGLHRPRYHHHRLVRDAGGRRLAKRDKDMALAALRAQGLGPADVRRLLGEPDGLMP